MKQVLIFFCAFILSLNSYGQIVKEQLIARTSGSDTLWDATIIDVMGFATGITQNVIIPSPLLTFIEGDSIEIDLWNISQGVPHTIHLHGLDVDQANDGVPHLSFEVHHMKHGIYRFIAPHPGAYLYHCHVTSPIHVQGGMYGMIVVKPSGSENLTWENGHSFHHDYNWLMSEVDTFWHTKAVMKHVYDTSHQNMQVPIPPYKPQYFLINGKSDNELENSNHWLSGKANEYIYLRLANVGNYSNRFIFPSSLNSLVISSDGRPLPQSENTDTLDIFPGERFGVLFHPTSQFIDSILVLYKNMNTGNVKNIQKVPVSIQGFLSNEFISYSQEDLSLFPNPTSQKINLKFNHDFSGEVSIYNSMSVLVYKGNFAEENKISIDLSTDLSNGIYHVLIKEDNRIEVKKFVLLK